MSGIDHVGLFVRSLDNLMKNTKDRHAHLRAACNFVKPRIQGESNSAEGTVPLSEQEKANLCFYPLKLACETREPILVSPAIGCLEKLLAHGFCTLEMIYEPPAVPEPQEKKGFFSGGSSSPPPANKDAPKPGVSPRAVAENSDLLIGQIVATVCNVVSTNSEELQLQTIRVLLTAVSTPACALHGPYLLAAIRTIYNIFLSAASQGPANPTQTTAKASLSQIVGIVLSRLESEQAEQSSAAGSDAAPSTPSKSEPASPVAHHSRNVSNLTLSDVDEEDAGGTGASTVFASPSEKDCFLILNSLCSLSQKSDDVVAVWSVEMQSKILSLSLLQSMLSSGGNLFMTRPAFSELIRNRFWKALLNACASATAEVARTAMRLFSHIVLNFRAHLKAEIGTFFYKVIFPLLETQSTSFAQKHIILTTLMGICSDSQVVCDLFVNYDCAIGCKPLYENLIYRVAKVIQTTWTAPNWVTQEEENDLKLEALNVLTQITRGINAWYEKKQKSSESAPTSPEQPAAATASTTGGGADGVSFSAEENKAFENLRKNKKEYEEVVMAFNEKAKNGIKMGLERGLIKEDTPAEIAAFLETPGLNKVIIGDYLAEVKNKDVLVCFIDRNDFKDLSIDEAMRLFLGKFKIKGEAQVVDRTMEIFTEIYCAQNPEAFSSASAAFILSFAIMMLNTDAHNPNIKPENKMQLNSFLRTVAGIDDGKDLPRQFCEDIYRRITTREIKLQGDSNVPNAQASPAAKAGDKDDANKAPDGIFLSQRKRKEMQQRMESQNIAKSSMEVDGATWGQLEHIAAASSDVVVAMWECSWISTLAAYSYPLEEREEQQLVDVCLRGFTDAVRLCCNVNADTEREAFLANLAKFTHLTSTREMEPKNVKSLMTLLTIASREADYLGSSWYEVLKCISLLDKLHMVSNSRDLGASASNRSGAERSAELRRVEQHNAELVTKSMDMGAVEKLFANSAELGGPAVVHLVEALCRLSAEELGEAKLRTYSLQKLVEVAEQNVSRLRFEWSQMWHHLSAHFISAGLSKNRNVSMFATDSLRQLAMKFLGRDELGNFNFQRDFLKPFDVIATQTRQTEIRELIAASIEQMTRARAKNIMSGWKVILSTLSRLAKDVHTTVVTLGFQVLDYLVLHCTHYFATKDLFVELCATLSRFADNVCSTDVSQRCVSYIRASAKFLLTGMPSSSNALFADASAGQQTPTRNSVDGEGEAENLNGTVKKRTFDDLLMAEGEKDVVFLQGSADSLDMHLWLSVCAGLSSLVNVAVENIAVEAIDGLFDILSTYGHLFDAEQWHLVVAGTVHPIVENTLVNVSLITRDDPTQDQSINRAAIVVKRTLEMYTHLLKKFPVVLAERVQVEAITAVLSSYHAQHGRLVTIGDSFLRAVLAPAPGQDVLVKGFSDQEYQFLQDNLATWVTSYHQQTEGEAPRLQTLSTVAQVCTDILGYGLETERMTNATAHTFLDIIERSLSFVQLRLDCAVTMTDGGATLEAAEVTVLLAVEMDCFEGLFRALAIMEDETLYASWISKVLLRHKNALASPRSSDPTQNESNVLAQVSGGLLENMLGMPDAFFLLVATVAYEVLCEAIRSCNPVICEPLASVLLRYGRLHQSGTETLPAARKQEEPITVATPNVSGEATPVVSAPPEPQAKKGGKKGKGNKNNKHQDPSPTAEPEPVAPEVEETPKETSESPQLETSGGDDGVQESGFKWGSGEATTADDTSSGFKWGSGEASNNETAEDNTQWSDGNAAGTTWGATDDAALEKKNDDEDDL